MFGFGKKKNKAVAENVTEADVRAVEKNWAQIKCQVV